jgi:CubicO group peptidase (beta-lactamase class C family)
VTRRLGGRPYTGDSVSILMSVSKGMTATCVHLLTQRGLLDVDASVARYWPEFAANGKQHVTVRHMCSPTPPACSGFPVEARIGPRDLLDWDRCVTALAGMAPLWEPGTAFAYR